MAWGNVWQGGMNMGVCVAEGMHGREACMVGVCMALGYALWGYVWQGECIAGVCMAGGHA